MLVGDSRQGFAAKRKSVLKTGMGLLRVCYIPSVMVVVERTWLIILIT